MSELVAVADNSRDGRVHLLSLAGPDVLPGSEDTMCHGWGQAYQDGFHAVFAHTGRLWLRAHERLWDLAAVLAVRQVRDGLDGADYELDLADGTTEGVSVRLLPERAAQVRADEAYDEVDSWCDDLMRLLPHDPVGAPGALAEWHAKVLPVWSDGIWAPVE